MRLIGLCGNSRYHCFPWNERHKLPINLPLAMRVGDRRFRVPTGYLIIIAELGTPRDPEQPIHLAFDGGAVNHVPLC